MVARQNEHEGPRNNWLAYVIIFGLIVFFIVLPIAALVYFKEEIRQAQGYGYLGVFVVGLLCGISIIPTPTQLLIFTFGGVLKPLYGFGPDIVGPAYVGTVAGVGSAIGGLTVYLTGAGVLTIWSKFRRNEQALEHRLGLDATTRITHPRFWTRVQAFYNRMVKWMGGKGGAWALFITSAMVISPFYPAGLVAGSTRMGLSRFFLISLAGRIFRYLYIAYAGYWGLHYLLRWFGG